MAYDEKCYELAQHFAPEGFGEKLTESLAQRIQDFIEDALASIESDIRVTPE